MKALDKPELFIEIGVEEIPVAEINPAVEYLSNKIEQLFKAEHITFKEVKTFSTPRRLALSVMGISDKGEPSITTYTGPRRDAAFDKDGNPTQAAIGFARSKGMDIKALKVVKLDKGEFVQVEIKKPGIQTKMLIKERLRNIILNIPFQRSMRWGDWENSSNDSIRFIRPIRWIVVLYNGKIVPISLVDVKSSSYTYGLRTGNGKRIKVNGVDSWLKAMQKEKVLPDVAARRENIMRIAEEIAQNINGKAQPDIALLDTITNLVESPVAVLGSFDKRFMNLPEDVIMSVMKTHQKYIPIADERLALMPYFIGISNNPYGDKAIIRKGYERVLNARLEDAEFYYHEDIKQPLEFYVELLKGMAFYPRLGSLYDKTQRIVGIASFLCDEIKVDEALKTVTIQAARLCKADLATRLVSEFPELQGIIGKHYIQNSKLKIQDSESTIKQIANAVFEHSGKDIPQTIPGTIVSIADKIDSLVGFFSIGEVPTGTQDPYGLRRAAIGIINAILQHSIGLNIKKLIQFSFEAYNNIASMRLSYPSDKYKWVQPGKDAVSKLVLSYLYGRLEGVLRERYYTEESFVAMLENAGNPVNKLINAVLAIEPDNILEVNQRIDALKDVIFEPQFEPIMLAFKRVMNISKKHFAGDVSVDILTEEPEKALYNSYLKLEPAIQLALAKGDYISYIKLIRNLVEPINTFFDKVLVMSDNEEMRTNRLNLLAKIKNLVMQVLDITKLI